MAEENYESEVEHSMKFLLLGIRGEQEMMKIFHFLSMKDVFEDKLRWQPATKDYSINPFGKLVRVPARVLDNGRIMDHKKHYHGFFVDLRCSKPFYENHKEVIDSHVVKDGEVDLRYRPKWL